MVKSAIQRGWEVVSLSRSGKPFTSAQGHTPGWASKVCTLPSLCCFTDLLTLLLALLSLIAGRLARRLSLRPSKLRGASTILHGGCVYTGYPAGERLQGWRQG